MTPRNLFNVVLKIFGLFFLREIVYTVPQLISSIEFLIKPDGFPSAQSNNGDIIDFILILAVIAFYLFIIYQLLFKTNNIVDKLKLDKGFNQEEFTFNISTLWVLTIAIIVTGGVILTNEIPNFCRQFFSYFQEKRLTHGTGELDFSYTIISGVKIIIGLLLIGERKRIVEFVERRQSKEEDSEIE